MPGICLLGLWVIVNDVLFPALFGNDNVAHLAHLGGFALGMALAIVLMVTRQCNAYGSDLLSLLLGRYAWPLVGKP